MKFEIRRYAIWSIVGPAQFQITLARRMLRFRPKNYFWMPAYRSGRWDGWLYPVSKNGAFPSGLSDRLVNAIRKEGYEVEVKDLRKRPEPTLSLPPLQTELLPHQLEAVDAIEKHACGIILHPVGSGKTLVIVGAIERLKVPSLICVHTRDLLYQHVDRLKQFLGVEPGICGDGIWEPKEITVATIQTLSKDLAVTQKTFGQYGAVFVDEVQHIEARTFRDVMSRLGAYYRVGLSATPFKDGTQESVIKVESWLGPVIHSVAVQHGIESGRLVPADIWVLRMSSPSTQGMAFSDAYRRNVVENDARNRLIVSCADRLRHRGPVLILVRLIDHGRRLEEELKASGIQAVFLHGGSKAWHRRDILSALKKGTVQCVIATVIFDEGVDAPSLRTLILAGGGVAPHRQIQRIGRGQRAAEGKRKVTVIDIYDCDGGRIEKQARSRLNTYLSEPAYTVRVVPEEEVDNVAQNWTEALQPESQPSSAGQQGTRPGRNGRRTGRRSAKEPGAVIPARMSETGRQI